MGSWLSDPSGGPRGIWAVLVLLAVLLVLSVCAVRAEPPAGNDPNSPLAQWVHSIHRLSTGYPCCSLADCRPTQVRPTDTGMEAWIGKDRYGEYAPDAWMPIPEGVIDDTAADGAAPDGRGAWVCFYGGEVHCAVLGFGD